MAKRKGPAELPPHRIETRRVADLTPAAYNPRKIDPKAMAGLTASVERFGAVQPIIVNERTGHIVGGHQRLKALQQLGQTETTVVVVDLSEPDERALNVTLNNPHIAGEFSEGLGALLDTISDESPGLFGELRLDALLAYEPPDMHPPRTDTDDDDVTRAPGEEPQPPGPASDEIRETSTREIDVDEFSLACKCPRCGFEFNDE